MLDLSLIEENQIKALCTEPLSSITSEEIKEVAMSLFPIKTFEDPIDMLYKNLWTYYNIRMDKKAEFDQITKEVVIKAKQKGIKVQTAIQILFKGTFLERFKTRLLKSRGLIRPPPANGHNKSNQANDGTERKVFTFGNQANLGNNKSEIDVEKNVPINDNKSVSSKTSRKQGSVTQFQALKEIKRAPLKLTPSNGVDNNNVVTESGVVSNLTDQVMCFCGKHVSLIELNKEPSLFCFQCNKRYHSQCMKRQVDSKICSFCHLRKLIPNKEVKKVLFVGLLQKGRKKHEIFFNATEEDLSIQFKIQIRCFRIKEGCQNFVLFPDAVTFSIRGSNVKEFAPLHRQSSLKFRKDEPFYISAALHAKENKIVITEKHPSKQTKDQRINLENHLIGIYVIEQKKIDWLIKDWKEKCLSTFAESKEILDTCFRNGSVGDQITCQIIKIPLTCSLTTEKLKLPARGVLCTHYQCFDLRNFLELTVNSSNPRWICPLCKMPTYEFKIDTILSEILQLHKQNIGASEVIFLRSGEFKVFQSQDKECVSSIHNIFDLPIDSKMKRKGNIPVNGEEGLKKKGKYQIVIE